MTAREATDALVIELLEERGFGLANVAVEDVTEGRHGNLWDLF